jgi:DNA repair protein RecN (Recombination protein N)
LAELSGEASVLLSGAEDGQPGALDALGSAEQALTRLARIDPTASGLLEQLTEASALLDDLAREVGNYREGIEFNPKRLQQVEERLHLIRTLQRKYGDTIEDVNAYGERAARELETISNAEERIAELEAEAEKLLAEMGRRGAELSAARRGAGERMSRAIERELADLQMDRASFAVEVRWTDDAAGAIVDAPSATRNDRNAGRYAFDNTGLDAVAFLVSANPGEPLRPLAKVASGGETSRLMLALKTVLGRADETPTLIFDEIDQGIGGRVGGTVGLKLWGLTVRNADESGHADLRHQVLCITHLPQLAAYGDRHYHVAKQVAAGRTKTEVRHLADKTRVTELARMLGADTDAGRASVAEMMAEVDAAKAKKS